MLPRTGLSDHVRELAGAEPVTPAARSDDPRDEVFDRLSRIAVGQQFRAEVLSRLDSGTFVVKLADMPVRLALPADTGVGTVVDLKLIGHEPRPTFLLTPSAGSASAEFSSAGKLIAALLQRSQADGASVAVVSETPLIGSRPSDLSPEQLAKAMHRALDVSGVFYESHLQEWLMGSRSLSQVVQEPQAKGAQYVVTGSNDPRASAADSAALSGHQKQAEALHALILLPASSRGHDGDVALSTTAATMPAVEPAAAAMLNRQLDVLEHHRVEWQGQLWPGQPVQWSVENDSASPRPSADLEEKSWTSKVRFALPSLGNIEATLQLRNQGVELHLRADNESTIAQLNAHVPLLATALAAAGSPLNAIAVKQHGAS